MVLSFEERWNQVMKQYQEEVRKDETLKKLLKRHKKMMTRVEKMRDEISIRQTKILSEEVEKEFCK